MRGYLARVSPQKRGEIPPEHQRRMRAACEAYDAAEAERRSAVVDALHDGASVREIAAFLDMSTNTINRWGREGGWPSAEIRAQRDALRKRNAEWRAFIEKNPQGPPPT